MPKCPFYDHKVTLLASSRGSNTTHYPTLFMLYTIALRPFRLPSTKPTGRFGPKSPYQRYRRSFAPVPQLIDSILALHRYHSQMVGCDPVASNHESLAEFNHNSSTCFFPTTLRRQSRFGSMAMGGTRNEPRFDTRGTVSWRRLPHPATRHSAGRHPVYLSPKVGCSQPPLFRPLPNDAWPTVVEDPFCCYP